MAVMTDDDWKAGDPLRPGGAHSRGELLSYEEALARDMARRAAWRERPDVKDWLAREARAARELAEEKAARRGRVEAYGPPNPYKPHRRG